MLVECSTRLGFNQDRSTTDFNSVTYEELQEWLDGISRVKPLNNPIKVYTDRDYKSDSVLALVAVWTEQR